MRQHVPSSIGSLGRRVLDGLVACAAVWGLLGCGGGGGSAAAPQEAAATAVVTNPVPVVEAAAPSLAGSEDARALKPAPVVRLLRDDRVVTVEMDYDANNAWGQFWTMSGAPDDDAGFLVVWWPQATTLAERTAFIASAGGGAVCLSTDAEARSATSLSLPPARTLGELPVGAKWLVTGNRRVQLQPLDNDRAYQVRVQRLSTRGKISSRAAELAVNGGDGTRVAALRASLSHFDDFNLPLGPADETLWNNASTVSADGRFNLFFVNDQFHAHTLHGTRADNTGDRSQTSQRFRKRLRLEPSGQRRIVFDMDSPLSPRSVWYLDLNPVPTEVTGHASFFDEEGAVGLPAGILRLRAQFQTLSVSIVDMQGASHQIASVDMEALGRQAVSNVRRAFDVRVSTGHVQVFIDGARVIDKSFAPYALPPADYELLWVAFGYNTLKDGVPYFLQHWDNFGFDGPVVDARTVHNYVTRIAGTDFAKSQRSANQFPTFTVKVPDDLRPLSAGATAEAWLVYTYQMGDYSFLNVLPNDFVQVNGAARHTLPPPANNSMPLNPAASDWGTPHTARIKLGDLVRGGASPLLVGDNTFRFHAENAGLLNVHVEVLYPAGSAPAYTPPAAIHHAPAHAELPRLGPPVRLQRIGTVDVGGDQHITNPNRRPIAVSGVIALNIEAGNRSWAGWAPELMNMPVQSTEVWSTGGTSGISKIEVFLRRANSRAAPGELVLSIDTARDAPAPQGRYLVQLDTRGLAAGDYELFVQATTPAGLKSHPSYGDETYRFDAAALSGAYYPIPIRVQN